MAYKKNKADVDQEQKFETEQDANTMQRHQEITADPDRHQRAADHLMKQAAIAQGAHKAARKTLEKKTKGRLKKTFGGGPDKAAGTFEGEKDKEQGQMEQTVNEKE